MFFQEASWQTEALKRCWILLWYPQGLSGSGVSLRCELQWGGALEWKGWFFQEGLSSPLWSEAPSLWDVCVCPSIFLPPPSHLSTAGWLRSTVVIPT